MESSTGGKVSPPRMPEVAKLAGVSIASVDRVLNRRGGVRPATAQRVLRAAAELRYVTDAELEAAAAPRPMRLTFLLPAGTNQFLRMLGHLISTSEAQAAAYAARCRVETIRSFNPVLLARRLLQHGAQSDGIAFMAIEHPAVRDAVNQLAERGIPAVTLISDIANTRRAAYVGLDNRAAGRTAGFLMSRFIGARRAKVAMIAGSLSYRAHEERELGFRHLFQEQAPHVTVVGLREGHDDEAMNYRQTRQILAEHADLAGIYNIGGGSGGVGRALKEMRRERDVILIGHGLTADTRALLIDGTMDAVITQNPRSSFLSCLAAFDNARAGRLPSHGVETARGEIILRENLPD
jgi:LacI family transcriptional regulator